MRHFSLVWAIAWCGLLTSKRSCLLDVSEIERQDRATGMMDVSLTWQLD